MGRRRTSAEVEAELKVVSNRSRREGVFLGIFLVVLLNVLVSQRSLQPIQIFVKDSGESERLHSSHDGVDVLHHCPPHASLLSGCNETTQRKNIETEGVSHDSQESEAHSALKPAISSPPTLPLNSSNNVIGEASTAKQGQNESKAAYTHMNPSGSKFPRVFVFHPINATLGRRIYETKERFQRRKNPPDSKDDAIRPPPRVKFVPRVKSGFDMGPSATKTCVPMAEWQTKSFPTCNFLHEHNFMSDVKEHLNLGEYRDVWKVKMGPFYFAMKTLRLDNEKLFSPARAEQHRIDAAATERLSASSKVASIYAYCGQSVINGLGKSSGTILRNKKHSSRQKLKFALDAARGIADAHGIDYEGGASLVHRDIRGPNFLVSNDGKSFILHDFGAARVIKWDPSTNLTCGFIKENCNPYRSPEECLGKPLTEKIDVYALGNVFYEILTARAPYSYPTKLSDSAVKVLIVNGTLPKLPKSASKSGDRATGAIVKAMKKCLEYNPEDRPSAKQVADELKHVLIKMTTE